MTQRADEQAWEVVVRIRNADGVMVERCMGKFTIWPEEVSSSLRFINDHWLPLGHAVRERVAKQDAQAKASEAAQP